MDEASAALRVTAVNRGPVAPRGEYVLYWMIAARRTAWSFARDRARGGARPATPLHAHAPNALASASALRCVSTAQVFTIAA